MMNRKPNVMAILILSCVVLGTAWGCDGAAVSGSDGEPAAENQKAASNVETVDKARQDIVPLDAIKNRIRIDATRNKLNADMSMIRHVPKTRLERVRNLKNLVNKISNSNELETVADDANTVEHVSDALNVKADLNKGFYYIRNAAGYDLSNRLVKNIEKNRNHYISKSKDVMRMLGADANELSNVVVTGLTSETISKDSKEGSVQEEVAKLVYVHRSLGGIHVQGDRVAVLFDSVGEVKKVIGQWREIDSIDTRIQGVESEDQLTSEAAEFVHSANLADRSANDILTGLHWVIERQEDGTNQAKLKGYVAVTKADDSRETTGGVESFDFDLH